MKQKKYFILVAAAALLTACSGDDLSQVQQVSQPDVNGGEITFDAYVNRGITRAGNHGILTTSSSTTPEYGLKSVSDGSVAFGVFGYYTNGEPYSGITKPNFFYNQKVYYNGSKFTYTPVRYWPNEFGGDAISDQVDKVTLFSYAPYVQVDPLTGVVSDVAKRKENIIGMSRNNVTGDPYIKYVSTMDPENTVDLCYGVAANDYTSSSSSANPNNIKAGSPYLNVVKPGTDVASKINFKFNHALAQMHVTIDAKVNDQTNGNPSTTVQTAYSRIWVRSVTFTGITQSGSLNLNSNGGDPEWYDINGTNRISTGSLTVYDGRKDGKEANDKAPNESPATLNENIVQAAPYELNDATPKGINAPSQLGVTNTEVNLFQKTGSNNPIFVIPTGEPMRVTIVYDVETVDENLPYYLSDGKTQGTTIENTIYKDIEAFGHIEAGKKYTLKLHLGMRTVDFDATVADWTDVPAGNIDLPANRPTFSYADSKDITLGWNAGTYEFAIKGYSASEGIAAPTLSPVAGSGLFTSIDPSAASSADGSGYFNATLTLGDNETILDRTGTVTVAGTGSHTGNTVLTIKQTAHPLGLSAAALSAAGTNIVLSSTATMGSGHWTGSTITVKKNDVTLTGGGTDYDNITESGTPLVGTIVLKTGAAVGDVYTVTVNPGTDKAPAETVTIYVTP